MLFFLCFVFFFKQKTAYEMRISDWSSDVCSSDLFAEHDGYRMRIAACGFDSARRGYIIKSVEDRAGGKRRPDRRLHSRDPAPLLIYPDRQIITTVQGTPSISQSAKLHPFLDVSLEHDIDNRFAPKTKVTRT